MLILEWLRRDMLSRLSGSQKKPKALGVRIYHPRVLKSYITRILIYLIYETLMGVEEGRMVTQTKSTTTLARTYVHMRIYVLFK